MEMPKILQIKQNSFFEEHKQTIKDLSVALSAVALVAMSYAGIKSGFFTAAISFVITHPIISGALLTATLAACAGVWLMFSADATKLLGEDLRSKALLCLKVAFAAVASIGVMYVGVKTGAFSALFAGAVAFTLAHPHFIITAIALGVLLTLGATAKLVLPDEKVDEIKEVIRDALASKTAHQARALVAKINQFTIDEKCEYLEHFEKNLTQDGFYEMWMDEQIDVYVALMDIDLWDIYNEKQGFEIIKYKKAYFSASNDLLKQINESRGFFLGIVFLDFKWELLAFSWIALANTSLLNKIIENKGRNEISPDWRIAMRAMSLLDKNLLMKQKDFSHIFLDEKTTEEKIEHLAAFGYVNLQKFQKERSSQDNKVEFAKNYRNILCREWNKLYEQDPKDIHVFGYYLLALRKADQLDQIVGIAPQERHGLRFGEMLNLADAPEIASNHPTASIVLGKINRL